MSQHPKIHMKVNNFDSCPALFPNVPLRTKSTICCVQAKYFGEIIHTLNVNWLIMSEKITVVDELTNEVKLHFSSYLPQFVFSLFRGFRRKILPPPSVHKYGINSVPISISSLFLQCNIVYI